MESSPLGHFLWFFFSKGRPHLFMLFSSKMTDLLSSPLLSSSTHIISPGESLPQNELMMSTPTPPPPPSPAGITSQDVPVLCSLPCPVMGSSGWWDFKASFRSTSFFFFMFWIRFSRYMGRECAEKKGRTVRSLKAFGFLFPQIMAIPPSDRRPKKAKKINKYSPLYLMQWFPLTRYNLSWQRQVSLCLLPLRLPYTQLSATREWKNVKEKIRT